MKYVKERAKFSSIKHNSMNSYGGSGGVAEFVSSKRSIERWVGLRTDMDAVTKKIHLPVMGIETRCSSLQSSHYAELL
jgi:hypothetical protein